MKRLFALVVFGLMLGLAQAGNVYAEPGGVWKVKE